MEFRQFLSILLVFALLAGALWILRRGASGSLRVPSLPFARTSAREKAIVSIERLALTPQHSLHVLRIQGREVVVATHPHGCALLTEINEGLQS